ncbi:hypothetical protein PA05_1551 [Cutibacterium acnes P05]|nr:hypothetical protein [Cutibacterium acnes P05]
MHMPRLTVNRTSSKTIRSTSAWPSTSLPRMDRASWLCLLSRAPSRWTSLISGELTRRSSERGALMS